ncbi:MAG: glycosyltransferase [Bacteroidota bacterium]
MLLFVTFFIVVIIQIFYFYYLFGKFSYSGYKEIQKENTLPVSVIICARNEETNLKNFLPYIAEQNHPDFEIILVNDASTDHSFQVMQDFKKEYLKNSNISKIQIITLTESKGKKNALEKGIRIASNKFLLLTDADCKPISNKWVSKMSLSFNNGKTIILGYGAYQKIKKSFLNKLIRFETLMTAIQYFSYANLGIPYMGVGRNIAYAKNEFYSVKGFDSHKHIKSGDDDLLINQIATKNNSSICTDQDAFTISIPKTNFKVWFNQKRRHITTATNYKKNHQFLLGLFYVSQFLFWFLAIGLILKGNTIQYVLLLIFFRFLFWYITIYKSAKMLNETDLIFLAPVLEIGIICTQMCIFIVNIVSPQKKW